jgi:hypothetical protein
MRRSAVEVVLMSFSSFIHRMQHRATQHGGKRKLLGLQSEESGGMGGGGGGGEVGGGGGG